MPSRTKIDTGHYLQCLMNYFTLLYNMYFSNGKNVVFFQKFGKNILLCIKVTGLTTTIIASTLVKILKLHSWFTENYSSVEKR